MYSGLLNVPSVRLIKPADETNLTTDPTYDSKGNPQSDAHPLGKKENANVGQKAEKPVDTQREYSR